MSYQLFRMAQHDNYRSRLQFLLVGLAAIAEGLIIVLSLGCLQTDLRAYVLFEVLGD